MITFDNVSKQRGGVGILDAVSFTAAPGRVTGFLGKNGAGKSSAMRILLGMDKATSGAALIDGRPYAKLKNPLRKVGSSLGGASAHPARSARSHLRWLAASNQIPRAEVDRVLAAVELTRHARRPAGKFSLGMAQRLGLAAALLGSPAVLVLDEPLNGLDPDGIAWLRATIRSHADRGGTVLLSSHVISELAAVADDIVVIDHGRILAAGTATDLARGHGSLESAYFSLVAGAQR